jgi:hypothetical protein
VLFDAGRGYARQVAGDLAVAGAGERAVHHRGLDGVVHQHSDRGALTPSVPSIRTSSPSGACSGGWMCGAEKVWLATISACAGSTAQTWCRISFPRRRVQRARRGVLHDRGRPGRRDDVIVTAVPLMSWLRRREVPM